MLRRHQLLIRENGFEHAETVKSAIFIHMDLGEIRKMHVQREIAQSNGWRTAIDFRGLPMRVMEMRDQLKHLMNHKGVSGDGPVERGLRKAISRKGCGGGLARLARVPYPPQVIYNQSWPGLYVTPARIILAC